MERFTDSRTWYVCFTPSGVKRWWNLFLSTPFQHVALFTEVEGGVMCINPLAHCMAIKIYPGNIKDYLCGIVLSRTVHYGMLYQKMPLMPMTCTTVACRILGIKKRILTPKGLYNEMVAAGANIVSPYNPCGNAIEVL